MTTSDDGDWLANAAEEPEWAAAIGTSESSRSASQDPPTAPHDSTSAPGSYAMPENYGTAAGTPAQTGSSVPDEKVPFGGTSGPNRPEEKPAKPRRGDRAKSKQSKSKQPKPNRLTPSAESHGVTTAPGGTGQQLTRRQRKAAEKAREARRPRPKMRLLPRSVLGASMLILAAGIGAAISGTALYMNYAYRRDVSDAQVKGLRTTISRGVDAVKAEGTNARFRIQQELEPLLRQAAIGDTLAQILRDAQPSLWSVRTFDEAGQPTVGTAFVVASDAEKSFLLTSLSVVRASIVRPGPEIFLQQDKTKATATLWSWQEDKDVALLIMPTGNLPKLQWAASDSTKVGTQVFAVSGFGTAGGAVTNGFIADVSTSGVQHSAALGTAFRGGPLLDGTGKVVALLSKTYSPFGFASDGVWFAPPVTAACDKVLKCPNGQVTGAGPEQASAPAPGPVPIPTAVPRTATSTIAP